MNSIKSMYLFILLSSLPMLAYAQTAEDFFKEGEAKSRQSNYEAAIEEYTKAISVDAQYWNAYLKRAFCYGLIQNYEKAIEDYTVTIGAEPDKIFSYQSRGSAHYKLGHYTEAMADFNKVLELDPKNQEAYNNRGFVKKSIGDKEGACKDWYTSKRMGNEEAKIIIKNNNCR